MMTIASYPYEELVPFMGMNMPSKKLTTNEGSFKVYMSGVRLECLKRNRECVWCHRAGNVWLLQAGKRGSPQVGMNCFREDCPWCAKYYYSSKGSLTWEEFKIKMTKHAGPH